MLGELLTTPANDTIRGYMPVHVGSLLRVPDAPVDIFVQIDQSQPPTLYCRAGLPVANRLLMGLAEAGIRDVFVQTRDFQAFGSHVLELIQLLSANDPDAVPLAEQFSALQLAVAMEVERTIQLVDCGKYFALSQKVGREIAGCLAKNDVLPRELFRMARHDFSTFAHVTNVAAYAVVLAGHLGIGDSNELEQIATAAMLHDLGKRHIPVSILTKPSQLTPAERSIIESHPTRGYEELCDRSDLTFAQLMMVYQHHERIDGEGYPVGITGEDIHPWAKMLAVVDVFDAMTGKRPYRRAAASGEAISYLKSSAGSHLDKEIVQCWASVMNQRG